MNMLNKLRLFIVAGLAIFYLLPLSALAAPDCTKPATLNTAEAIQCGTNSAAGVPQDTKVSAGQKIDTTIQNIINLLSVAVGIAAVIMLIIGGFRYVTSAGNQETVKAAKNTILYALIGLVIVALAQFIVNFVLNKTTQPPPKTTSLIDPRGA